MDDATYKIRVKLLHLLTPKTDKSSTFFQDFELFLKICFELSLSANLAEKCFEREIQKFVIKTLKNFIKTKKSISKNSSN